MESDIILAKKKYNPLTLKYIKILSMFLWPIGAWPGEMFGDKVPLPVKIMRITLPYQVFVMLVGQAYYLVKNFATINFFDMGHVFITNFLTVVTIARTALPSFKNYGIIIKDLITNFHLMHRKDKSEYDNKIFMMTDKISYYFTLYQMLMMVSGMTLFNLSPLYKDFKMGAFTGNRPENTSMDFAVFYEYPGFKQNDHFYLSTIINLYCSYNCSVSVCSIDLLLSLIVFQIIGHIKILMHNLETLPRPQHVVKFTHMYHGADQSVQVTAVVELFDEDENKSIHKKMVEMINHHRFIVTFADEISNFFGPMLALNYLFHLVSGCILLLECSRKEPEALARFGPLTCIIFGQLIQLSVVFEVVGYISEKLIDSVYYVPWECMNISNQKTVRFLLNRIQTPIQLTAMGIVPVGVQTMQGILKTTFSFFAFLQSLNE